MGIRHQVKFYNLFFVLFFPLIFLGANFCYAATGIGNAFNTGANSPLNAVAVTGAGFNTTATFETIVTTVITTVLGLLGVIFLVLAIYGGYNWMMARGNEDMVEKAKKTITNAVIGLIVVLSAYVITRFVVEVIGAKVFK